MWKPGERTGPFTCIVRELCGISCLSRRKPKRGIQPWVLAAIFRGGAVCSLAADFVEAPCFFFLQVDEQLRLNYNFSPKVEFRAVRSLTLGKVTGLYFCPLGFVKIYEWINDFYQDSSKWFKSRTKISGTGETMICVWWVGNWHLPLY